MNCLGNTIFGAVLVAAGIATVPSAALAQCPYHEYQPSIFDRNVQHVDTAMRCKAGAYQLPKGPGLGVEPRPTLWHYRMDA